jgi:hypothetical protein
MFQKPKIINFLFYIFLLSSCAAPSVNEDFNNKYGGQIDRIKMERAPAGSDIVSGSFAAPSQLEVMKESGDYYPYADVTKFGEKIPQSYLPGSETYDLSRNNNSSSLPADVFELKYNLALSPQFRRIGLEFDNIKIPEADVYGVKTAMSDKTYISPGGEILQKTIDKVEADKSEEDADMSQILVAEKKQISRKKKMEKIFGSYEEMTVDVKKTPKKQDPKTQEETAKKIEDSFNKQGLNSSSGFSIKSLK